MRLHRIIKPEQYEILVSIAASNPNYYKECIDHVYNNSDGDMVLNISEDIATELRDMCADEIWSHCDKEYNPDTIGLILEDLIDLLYC